jgi:hypothetical protein
MLLSGANRRKLAEGYEYLGYLDDQKNLLDKWAKEISLISAEEYTHALQDYLQRGVSRKAALIMDPKNRASFSHEADVALFFYEQSVTISKYYLNACSVFVA